MNKDDYARLRFLVNEEHPGTKPVRCGPEAGLGVHILRPTLFEVLVCGGKLAGRERFTSTGIHYDVHSVSIFDEPPPRYIRVRRRAGFYTRPFPTSVYLMPLDLRISNRE